MWHKRESMPEMGSFDAQLVVRSVEEVLAVDVFGREKP
jgi:hypothetical protein